MSGSAKYFRKSGSDVRLWDDGGVIEHARCLSELPPTLRMNDQDWHDYIHRTPGSNMGGWADMMEGKAPWQKAARTPVYSPPSRRRSESAYTPPASTGSTLPSTFNAKPTPVVKLTAAERLRLDARLGASWVALPMGVAASVVAWHLSLGVIGVLISFLAVHLTLYFIFYASPLRAVSVGGVRTVRAIGRGIGRMIEWIVGVCLAVVRFALICIAIGGAIVGALLAIGVITI